MQENVKRAEMGGRQILNYLHITRNPIGLIINFGSYKFERRTITA